MKTIASIILAITLLATPALASNPLLFEWSGVDSNNDPFSVAFTITDVQSSDSNYDYIDFGDPALVEITTEELTQDRVVTNVSSSTLGGAFTYPSTTLSDPYNYLYAFDDDGEIYLSLVSGADDSDVGLTFDGEVLTYIEMGGTIPLSWIDPTTVNALSELFPVGTYAVIGGSGFGELTTASGTESPTPTTLTISVVPGSTTVVPTPTAALSGLACLAGLLARRRRQARASMSQ